MKTIDKAGDWYCFRDSENRICHDFRVKKQANGTAVVHAKSSHSLNFQKKKAFSLACIFLILLGFLHEFQADTISVRDEVILALLAFGLLINGRWLL